MLRKRPLYGMWIFKLQSHRPRWKTGRSPERFHHIRFGVEGGGSFIVATTRPELLPACVAIVAHPDDQRYQSLFGKRAVTPLFRAPVPILRRRARQHRKGHRHSHGLHLW